jgi:hypothetical protein
MDTKNQAILSSRDGFTIFQFGEYTIRFRAPYPHPDAAGHEFHEKRLTCVTKI